MPVFCAVYGCSNRHDREHYTFYFKLSKVLALKGEQTRPIADSAR